MTVIIVCNCNSEGVVWATTRCLGIAVKLEFNEKCRFQRLFLSNQFSSSRYMESVKGRKLSSIHYVLQRTIFFIAGWSIFNLIHICQHFILTGRVVDFSAIQENNVFSFRRFRWYKACTLREIKGKSGLIFKVETSGGKQGEIKKDKKERNNFPQPDTASLPFIAGPLTWNPTHLWSLTVVVLHLSLSIPPVSLSLLFEIRFCLAAISKHGILKVCLHNEE